MAGINMRIMTGDILEMGRSIGKASTILDDDSEVYSILPSSEFHKEIGEIKEKFNENNQLESISFANM